MVIGALGGNRTHDPRLRRPILYPTELRAHNLSTTAKPINTEYNQSQLELQGM